MSDWGSEIVKVVANVNLYDRDKQQWIVMDSCRENNVFIFLNAEKQEYRIVGRNSSTCEITVDYVIEENLLYNEATPKFHQWKANEEIYGLHFKSEKYAKDFAQKLSVAVKRVKGELPWPEKNQLHILSGELSEEITRIRKLKDNNESLASAEKNLQQKKAELDKNSKEIKTLSDNLDKARKSETDLLRAINNLELTVKKLKAIKQTLGKTGMNVISFPIV
ncbi:Oidioi.mRNA.OKI2018_I69.chr1.g3908.t1.cds [Oikopleura dioica]|uniref:Oidioi.mRNA.OKI2018_I69.chr1.g3908.t1.cds n=1 Tax=Oikopleura dioica TaxID=34765 RepID=A0ABN7SXB8_OIKDI|nr:Oidioi.mRNA.OKI2018_I69.chr1.g3908.t1.cds [Oikopleura dioica]